MVYTLVQGRDRHTSAVGGERGQAEVEFWVRSFSLERWSTCTGVICISPFPNKPWFLHVCSTSLLKTLWDKETLFFTLLENILPFSSNLGMSSANSFSFEESKICCVGQS